MKNTFFPHTHGLSCTCPTLESSGTSCRGKQRTLVNIHPQNKTLAVCFVRPKPSVVSVRYDAGTLAGQLFPANLTSANVTPQPV